VVSAVPGGRASQPAGDAQPERDRCPARAGQRPSQRVVQAVAPRAGDPQRDRDAGQRQRVLIAAFGVPQTLVAVGEPGGIEHHGDDHAGRQRGPQAERQRRSTSQLGQAEQRREPPARPPAERLDKARGPAEPMAAEPAEQLLSTVARQQRASHEPKQQQTNLHPSHPLVHVIR